MIFDFDYVLIPKIATPRILCMPPTKPNYRIGRYKFSPFIDRHSEIRIRALWYHRELFLKFRIKLEMGWILVL